jgi:hypothetical protein
MTKGDQGRYAKVGVNFFTARLLVKPCANFFLVMLKLCRVIWNAVQKDKLKKVKKKIKQKNR